MAEEPTEQEQPRHDFFIGYTGKDRGWAEWIATQLEASGYHTIIGARDYRPGSNFVTQMDEAAKRAKVSFPTGRNLSREERRKMEDGRAQPTV